MTTPDNAQQLAQRCAESMYTNDKATQALGISIDDTGPGLAALSMTVREDMLNGHDNCQGGFIFALADSAFAYACNAYNQITVAQGCSIDFVRPVKVHDRLTATAKEQARGHITGVYDVTITRSDEKIVALFRGKSFATDHKLLDQDTD